MYRSVHFNFADDKEKFHGLQQESGGARMFQEEAVMGKHEDKELFLKHSKLFLDKVLRRNSVRFATALLAALSSLVAGLTPALAAAPEHHDQVPGFYRLKVGDLEVTALSDASVVFDPH